MQQLGRIVPLVQGLTLLQAVVALQAQELALQDPGECLGKLSLAHARLTLQQQGALQFEGQKDSCGQAAVGKVPHRRKRTDQVIDGLEIGHVDTTKKAPRRSTRGPGWHRRLAQELGNRPLGLNADQVGTVGR